MASATPALGSGSAGSLDKQAEKKRAEEQGQQQQGQQSPQQSGPLVHIENMNQGNSSGKSLAMDIAGTLSAQNLLPR